MMDIGDWEPAYAAQDSIHGLPAGEGGEVALPE